MIKFNPETSDIELSESGSLKTNNYLEDVAQRINFKINLDKGDWFRDRNAGIPWTSEIFKIKNKQKQLERVKYFIKKELENDEDFEELLSLNVEVDEQKRSLFVNFSIKCKNGKSINFTQEKKEVSYALRGY
ncbi:MAG: hypothetical protein ACRCX2_12565 [Paraclostridium sp.]|uniref:hypothetical protein n=1 Tax=Cetobacterium sp. TaxID=2071632 RepID=UPI003F33E37D